MEKRATSARAAFEGKRNLTVEDAVALVKGNANAKFDETVEIAVNLGIDPRHADQMVPRRCRPAKRHWLKLCAWLFSARDAKAEEAKKAGADIVGAEDLMEIVQSGQD